MTTIRAALFQGARWWLPAFLALAPTATAADVAVDVANLSVPTLCAEVDNVHITFSGDDIAAFRIEAIHPAYIGTLVRDVVAPDFADCDMSGDPSFPAPPAMVRIDVSDDVWLVGLTYPSFWRPADVPLVVNGKRYEGLHLVQLFMRKEGLAEEVLVVYPPDGYFRARPLTPEGFTPAAELGRDFGTAYGSSFLVGPVTEAGRPVVELDEIAFDPVGPAFGLTFAAGGSARVEIVRLDREMQAIEVTLDGAPDGTPFAALRSMYVTATNSDAAAVAWRGPDTAAWAEAPLMDFPGGRADRIWIGRAIPSRHNTSAPDHVFGAFRRDGAQ